MTKAEQKKLSDFLRLLWMRSTIRKEYMKTKRLDVDLYRCVYCGFVVFTNKKKQLLKKHVQKYGASLRKGIIHVDHIEPVEPVDRLLQSIDEKLQRLIPDDYSNLQILCKECHGDKTARENKQRKAFKESLTW